MEDASLHNLNCKIAKTTNYIIRNKKREDKTKLKSTVVRDLKINFIESIRTYNHTPHNNSKLQFYKIFRIFEPNLNLNWID